jgi:hypothetical protein
VTDEEVKALTVGQKVFAHYVTQGWVPCVVVMTFGEYERKYRHYGEVPVVAVRRADLGGEPLQGRRRKTGEDLRHPPEGPDIVRANVYADFLDDHGHPEAAALLRQAFPLGDGTREADA